MFNEEVNGLGETPPASPSIWDSLANVVSKGVSAGFNIYNRVQNIQMQKEQTKQANAQAAQIAQMYSVGMTAPMTGVQPGMVTANAYRPQESFLDGWMLPLLIGGVVLTGVIVLKRK